MPATSSQDKPGFSDGPKVPGVIQRLVGTRVEWLTNPGPQTWTKRAVLDWVIAELKTGLQWQADSAAALVCPDITQADMIARLLSSELGEAVYPAVRERVRKPAPLFLRSESPRQQMERHDWREDAPNCGVE